MPWINMSLTVGEGRPGRRAEKASATEDARIGIMRGASRCVDRGIPPSIVARGNWAP